MFDHDSIQAWFETSSSIRLMRSDHAALVISFLYQQFKGQERPVSLAHQDLLERLEIFLETLSDAYPNLYPRSAQAYLKEWMDDSHRIIRPFRRTGNDEYHIELTQDAERVLDWVESLQPRGFVGTESRLQLIFSALQDLVQRSTDDPNQRITQLEQEIAERQAEISRIRAGEGVARYTAGQLTERFQNISDLAREMLRDFVAVETNFRGIARQIQQAQLRTDSSKGSVIAAVLDAEDSLRDSEQGRSFYAFWRLLTSPTSRDSLQQLIEDAVSIPEIADIATQNTLLRRLISYLLQAGDKIVQSNRRLTEQLRRMLDEQNLAETRLIAEFIKEIKQMAGLLANTISSDVDLIDIDLDPSVQLIMERELWEPKEMTQITQSPQGDSQDVVSIDAFEPLFDQFYVNETTLRTNIETMLGVWPRCSLAEVLDQFPAQKGIPEVITYIAIASKDPRHLIDQNEESILEIYGVTSKADPPDSQRRIQLKLPYVMFRRTIYD